MKKVLPLICLFFCFIFGQLHSQVGTPCCTAPNIPDGCTEAGTSQANACIICSLSGTYSGNNSSYGATGNFSCGVPHNSAFVSVIADANGVIDATVITSNCTNNPVEGLQLILWDAAGNEIDCFSVGGALIATVGASGLTPGGLYTFQIDGFNGDACDFTIIVSGADTGALPDPPGPVMMDPDTTLCPGAEVCFEIDPVNNANSFEWILPPNIRITSGGGPMDLFVCGVVESPGGGAVRVTPSNFCFNGVPGILPVVALPIPPSIWPPSFVCNSDMPWDTMVKGKTYSFDTYGAHEIVIVTELGCDSIINLSLIPKIQIPAIVDTTICEGDCVMVGLDCYDEVGSTTIVLTDPRFQQANGCDSTVTLILRKLNPVATIAEPDDLPCQAGATVPLDGQGSSSGANISYQWIAQNGGTLASTANTNVSAASSPGTYILVVTESSADGSITCLAQDTVEVMQQVQILNDPVFSQPVTTNTCLGETYTYTIGAVSGAINYNWTVPTGATFTGAGTSIIVTFTSGTGGPICVQAIGECGESMEVCVPVTINPVPTSDFSVTGPICINESSTIQYTGTASPFGTFTWNFNGGEPASVTGPGPHSINWTSPGVKTITLTVEENGCTSAQSTQTVQVDSELATPVISCDPTQTSVTFSWGAVPGASDYTVTINGGAPTTQAGTTITQSGLSPGDNVTITVVANSTSACPSTMVTDMCTAQDCPTVTIDIPPVAAICRDASTSTIMLTATQTGGLGGGSFTWSGPGTSANGQFDPRAAGVGTNTVSVQYMEGTCTYTGSIDIDVNDVPDPSFTVLSPICETETSTVTYTGSASAGADYQWDFGSGTTASGTGAGPYEIRWTPGNQTVTLTVSENGCTSPVSTQPVQVDPTLPDPMISCGMSTTTSVSFSWDAVPGAASYQVNGPGGEIVDLAARTVVVNGVAQGAGVTIEIVAISGNECPNSSATLECFALNCPPETITPDQIGPFCDDGTGTPVALTATASTTGTFEWSGPGVSNNMFDPNAPAVNAGDLTLTVTLTEGICEWRETMVVTIYDKPTSEFTVEDPVCEGDISNIVYIGSADVANATFNWTFDGANGGNTNDAGPHMLNWTDGGTKTITLNVTENNCVSDETSLTVTVDEPLVPSIIECTSDQSNVYFTWDFIPNALDYTVTVVNAPGTAVPENPTQNTFNVGGLTPGDEVGIEVLVEGLTSCGPITLTGDCIAQDCPDIFVNWPSYDPICAYNGTGSFRIDTNSNFVITDLATGDIITTDVGITWSTGDPNTNYITAGGNFSPLQSILEFGEGDVPIIIEVEYPRGEGCFQTFSTTIPMRAIPIFGFFLDTEVCVTESLDLEVNAGTYSDPAATYTWDFGRANANPGGINEMGPHVLTWNEGGITDMISLEIVTPDNCELGMSSAEVTIDSVLNALAANLSCNPANTGNQMIEFVWDNNIPGVTDYDINVLTPGFTITDQTGSSAFFDGLTPGDEIELELVISNSASQCPPVSTSITCLAKQCDQVDITFAPILDNCLNATGSTTIQLEEILTPDPSGGAGTRIFSGGPHVSPTGEFTVDAQGNYPIQFEFSFDGCNYNGNTSIAMIETPIADFAMDDIICIEDAANITNSSIAHPDAVFTWDFDGGSPTSTDLRDPGTVNWRDAGDYTVSLSIDNDGCTAGPVTQEIQVDPAIDPLVITCDDQNATTTSVTINWNSDPNVTEYEIRVSYPVGTSPMIIGTQTNTDYTFNGMTVGDRNIEIIVTPITSSSCPAPAVVVSCSAKPCANAQLNDIGPAGPFCIDDDPELITATLTGVLNLGALTVDGPGIETTPSGPMFNPAIAGEGTHTLVFAYSEQGCDWDWSHDITVNPLPRVDAGADMILSCNDLSVDLSGNDMTGATYSWTNEDGTVVGTSTGLTVSDGGTYVYEITDANGCIDSDDVFVDASFSDPALAFELENISCFGRNDGTISIEGLEPGIPPFEYSFNGSPFSTTNTFHSNLGEGTYTIIGRDANGCEVTETITITEPDELFVEILISGGENPVPFGDSIELTANTNYDPADLTAITWSPADQFPICEPGQLDNCISLWVTPTGQTVYSVLVESGPGCSDEDNINIVGIKDHPIFIPSGFSPGDADGNNDFFGVFGDPEIIREVKSFLVFNRWGEVVYENYNFPPATDKTIDPANGWDGTFRGQPLNSGVFVYMVEVEFFDGLVELFKGDVTIK